MNSFKLVQHNVKSASFIENKEKEKKKHRLGKYRFGNFINFQHYGNGKRRIERVSRVLHSVHDFYGVRRVCVRVGSYP